MAQNITKLNILVSGTRETEAEKATLETVVEKLNKKISKAYSVEYTVTKWPDDFTPGYNEDPQSELNRQIENGSVDIYLGLLGTRFGTPTPRSDSGTMEELEIACQQFRKDSTTIRIFFYFKKSTTDVFKIDFDQLKKVIEFKDHKASEMGILYKEFEDTENFVDIADTDLYNIINSDWDKDKWKKVDISKKKVKEAETDKASLPIQDKTESIVINELAQSENEDNNEDKLGLLDMIGGVDDDIALFTELLERMTKDIYYLGNITTEYTAILEPMLNKFGAMGQVKGSSGKQKLLSNIKKELRKLSQEYKNKSNTIRNNAAEFKVYIKKLLDYYRYYLLDYYNPEHDVGQDEAPNVSLEVFIDSMKESLESIKKLQNSMESIPNLSQDLIIAKTSLVNNLGVLIAEFTFAINDGDNILKEYVDKKSTE